MNYEDIRDQLKAVPKDPDKIFELVRSIAYFFQHTKSGLTEPLDLIIRLIEKRPILETYLTGVGAMIDAVAREAGLYPYIEKAKMWQDELAVELMRAPGHEDIVFHIEQAAVFQKLAQGKSIILSAPTSFGKSLLIDALIEYLKPMCVMAVVPTIALLDEFRRRLQKGFPSYEVITTSGSVNSGGPTIFIGTQERLLERNDIVQLDLLVIDEFYKLDLDRNDKRSLALNAILAKYGRSAKQIYFLGPSIDEVPNAQVFRKDLEFIKTRYSPVTADIIDRTDEPPSPERLTSDLEKCKDQSSLIYVRSPEASWKLAYSLLDKNLYNPSSFTWSLAEWLGENFHPEWILATSLKHGIGIHHGRVPRSIAHLVIDLFNKAEIGAILCTSSMIDGVNTAAENVFIYDRSISTKKLDRFTFDNIKGRAGRMFRHMVGKIYLFNTPPEEVNFTVRVPLFDNDDRMAPELLVQLDDNALSPFARQRKNAITRASGLPPDLLRRWAEFGVEQLSILFEQIADLVKRPDSLLLWSGYPSFDELEATFASFWSVLDFAKHGLYTPRQAAHFANQLRKRGSIRAYMDALVQGEGPEAQRDIDRCFDFVRGCEYTFPQVIAALNDIIDVAAGEGRANYRFYTQRMQNLFLAEGIRILDEFGVPTPVASRVRLGLEEDPLSVVRAIQNPQSDRLDNLSQFERILVQRAAG